MAVRRLATTAFRLSKGFAGIQGDIRLFGRYASKNSIAVHRQCNFRLFSSGLDLEDTSKLFDLAQSHYYGRDGKTVDKVEAHKYFKLAADAGLADAQFDLGVMYFNGDGVPEDKREAVKCYTLAADQGKADAQFNLGLCYSCGFGTSVDNDQAFKYFKLAADKGQPYAQSNVGWCYIDGKGVAADPKEAFRYFKMSADQGVAAAQRNLGFCYMNGNGVTLDKAEAVKYFQLAADQGFVDAMLDLGGCYLHGDGVTADPAKAMWYLRLAADQGHTEAMYRVGSLLAKGKGDQDTAESFHYYKMAADHGHALGKYVTGCCYYQGSYVAIDKELAVKYFQEAAGEVLDAIYFLAIMYAEGEGGLVRDKTHAFQLFKTCSDHGFVEAHFHLALCYARGDGVEPNLAEADRLFALAASKGVEALNLLQLAVEKGVPAAQYNLGWCYEFGKGGVAVNPAEAVKYYKLAAEQSYPEARAAFDSMKVGFNK